MLWRPDRDTRAGRGPVRGHGVVPGATEVSRRDDRAEAPYREKDQRS
jgi:hypothetical protein